MFLKAYVEIEVPFARVKEAMMRPPEAWLQGLARAADEAQADGQRLLVEVGLQVAGRRLSRAGRLEVGPPLVAERVASLPIRLSAESQAALFPVLNGSLDAAWLGPERTQVALSAQYDPPLGLVGRAIDRALLHRVAETVARNFLAAAARGLLAAALEMQPANTKQGEE